VTLANRLVSVADTGDGLAALRFVDQLVEAGAIPVNPSNDTALDVRVVIRGEPKSVEARRRAEDLEAHAHVVLGSARPAFARLFASACARWVNS
jgi:hypothetical protein